MTLVSPSLLSANFCRLESELEMLKEANADMIHLDVMDGVFVPNISFGFPVIKSLRKYTSMPLDVHLMIVDPDRYITQVRDLGAEIMNIHVEACNHLHRAIQQIKQCGMKAGVTLNPATPLVMLEEIITDLDLVMLMSVNPGFGGQSFIKESVDKMRRLRKMVDESGSKALIEIDGGINLQTGAEVVKAGADILVAGNYVFSSENPREAIRSLQQLSR